MKMSAAVSPRKEEAVAIDDAAPVFALSRPDDGGQSRLARMSGKLSWFMARNVATKKLTMCNDKPLVTFTFDDAPASACTAGAALLEQYQARGTFYISGGGCGLVSPGGRLATAEQLKTLCAAGHEIGCHTFSHSAVAAVGSDTLAADLKHNQKFLQGIDSDIVIRNFAYPYGDLSFSAKRFVETHFEFVPVSPPRRERRNCRSRSTEELRTPELLDRPPRHSRHYCRHGRQERMADLCLP